MNNHKKGFYGETAPTKKQKQQRAHLFIYVRVRDARSLVIITLARLLALIHKKWMRQHFAPTDTKHHTRATSEQLAGEDLGSEGAFPPIMGRNPCRHRTDIQMHT
jgi:hypothetical protein